MYLQMNTHNGRDGGRAVCYDQPFYKLRPTFDNHLSTLSLQQTDNQKNTSNVESNPVQIVENYLVCQCANVLR